MPDSDHEEISRIRDWRHGKVDPALFAYRNDLRDLRRRMDDLEPKVDALVDSQKIANAVAAKMHDGRVNVLTTGQRLFGIIVGAVTVAASVKVFLGG